MPVPTLKDRIEHLEAEVKKLRDELSASRTQNRKDWRRTIGAFTGDEGMQTILRDAMRLRSTERKKIRCQGTSRGKPRR